MGGAGLAAPGLDYCLCGLLDKRVGYIEFAVAVLFLECFSEKPREPFASEVLGFILVARPSLLLFVLPGLFLQYGQVFRRCAVHSEVVFRAFVPERDEAVILGVQAYRFGGFLIKTDRQIFV